MPRISAASPVGLPATSPGPSCGLQGMGAERDFHWHLWSSRYSGSAARRASSVCASQTLSESPPGHIPSDRSLIVPRSRPDGSLWYFVEEYENPLAFWRIDGADGGAERVGGHKADQPGRQGQRHSDSSFRGRAFHQPSFPGARGQRFAPASRLFELGDNVGG